MGLDARRLGLAIGMGVSAVKGSWERGGARLRLRHREGIVGRKIRDVRWRHGRCRLMRGVRPQALGRLVEAGSSG